LKIITEICEGDARRSINTLQNLKYVPKKSDNSTQTVTNVITKDDVYNITSYLDKSYLDPYWEQITTAKISELHDIIVTITSLGHPMNYVLQCIKDKVLESNISDKNKADIFIHMGKIERMVTCGSDNWIQLLAVLTYINGVSRGIDIVKPKIY
jgi:DNA polymerase III delta prime subunit